MSRKVSIGIGVVSSIPILATCYLSVRDFGLLTSHTLFHTLASYPKLWILLSLPFSFGIFAYVLLRNELHSTTGEKFKERNVRPYRWVGMIWGTVIHVILVSSLVYYDQGHVSGELVLNYHFSHPLVMGLTTSVPFFFCLGYLIEKVFVSEKENREKAQEIAQQNEKLQKEIRERKIREKELVEAKKEALAGVKAKDQFLSNMSHEIRTPMNGVLGLINLILDSELTDEQRKYASAIDYSAKTLLVIINQILDLSKINSEKLTLECIDFSLRDTIQSVENTFRATAAEKGIVLRTIIDPKAPERVSGDPVRFNQILLNIVGNAIKFTENGGVDLIVNSLESDDGPRLNIEINDTGIGIAKDRLSSIFETFTQAGKETTRMYGGSGLGLAIAKELVELFGGRIKVESEIGKGTCFSFQLQLKKEMNPIQEKDEPTVSKNLFPDFSPSNIKVLLAEDNQINQLVAKSVLKKYGFEVEVASNGQEVIDKIFIETFDVILMDVQMPLMSGLDATRFIRNATEAPLSETKIIAMTASVMKEDIEKCMAVGMNDYIPKPFNPEELLEKLRQHLSSQNSH